MTFHLPDSYYIQDDPIECRNEGEGRCEDECVCEEDAFDEREQAGIDAEESRREEEDY